MSPASAWVAGGRASVLGDLRQGWRVLVSSRRLTAIFVMDGLGNIGFTAFSLGGLVLATERLGAGVGGYGTLIAAYGVGSLLGNYLAGNLDLRAYRVLFAIGAWAGIGAGFALLGLAPSLTWGLVATSLAGLCGSAAHVSRAAYIGESVPSSHLGKIYSLLRVWVALCAGSGSLLIGWLLDRFAPARVVGLSGLGIMAVALLTLLLSGGIAVLQPGSLAGEPGPEGTAPRLQES